MEKAEILQRLTGLALTEYQTPEGVSVHRDGRPVFSVHALREARRLQEDGRALNQVFITILQKETVEHEGQLHTLRCGSTLVLDLDEARVTYVIGKASRQRAPAAHHQVPGEPGRSRLAGRHVLWRRPRALRRPPQCRA